MSGMRRLLVVLGIACVALGAAALAGVAQPHGAGAATPTTSDTVTVNGTGTVTTVPDRASFDFGVTTKAATATAALSRNSADMRAVIAAIESAGVPDADVQTSEVSLDPVESSDGTSIVGFTASNTVTAQNVSLDKAGAVVDAAVGAGADTVSGPSLSTSSQDALYRRALAAAVAQAKAKAQALADAAGRSLGSVVSITEGSAQPPIVFDQHAAPAAGGVPIQPGTQQIQASVTVSYALS
jgi:uncharacterized protein YggE